MHPYEHEMTRTLSLTRRSSKKHSFLDAGTSIICEDTSAGSSSSSDHHIVMRVDACILAMVVRDVVELCEHHTARFTNCSSRPRSETPNSSGLRPRNFVALSRRPRAFATTRLTSQLLPLLSSALSLHLYHPNSISKPSPCRRHSMLLRLA